ncbi:MAG: VWA domain-containing protein [Chloroflexi bacterium]|nr:VWA domain-containing protein [Chloroflexota bacterium]
MKTYRYSEWDGSQDVFDLNAETLMDELDQLMMKYGDLAQALRALRRSGMTDDKGRQMPGLDKLLRQLRQRRQTQLERYDLGSVMDDIRQKLDEIIDTERAGIQKQLDEAKKQAESGNGELPPELTERLRQTLENRAAQNIAKLDELPPDVGGRVKELTKYDFMDPEARRMFQELLDQLKKNAMQSYMRDMTQRLQSMDAQSMAAMRNLLEAINQMAEAKRRGEEPDFDGFMQQFGDFFGPNPPRSFDELMERLHEQMQQAEALMESLSPEDRQALEEMIHSMFDDATLAEMAKLAVNMDAMFPGIRRQRGYPFSGEDSVSYEEAMKLMESLQKMDRLEQQIKEAQFSPDLDDINPDLVNELLGEEATREMEALREMAKILEEAGYIRKDGNRYALTPQGIRKIGQKALKDILSHMKRDHFGPHNLDKMGAGSERTQETRKYEFGDDFHIHIQKTIMNSLMREPGPPPVSLSVEDFEVWKTEESTRSAIVLIVDQSRSMFMNGYFDAAKRVAIALNHLIASYYPKDHLYIIGFSGRAHEIKREDLLRMPFPFFEHGTNFQHALWLARKLLAGQNCANKEIILVSDGEPTAHCEGAEVYFQHPPSLRTLQMTLKEVRNCTQKGIVINTFMFDDSPFFTSFVTQMAQINRGRVFFSDPGTLGKYLLLDYLGKKRRKVS